MRQATKNKNLNINSTACINSSINFCPFFFLTRRKPDTFLVNGFGNINIQSTREKCTFQRISTRFIPSKHRRKIHTSKIHTTLKSGTAERNSVDVHSLVILICGTIIPSVFSTLQLQQQDLIKGLYFNLSSPTCSSGLCTRPVSRLERTRVGSLRCSIPGVILFSINFFSRHDCHRLVTC